PKSSYYRDKVTGQEYSWIAGGFGWPGKGNPIAGPDNVPGFVLILAVDRIHNDDDPCFRVLSESEFEQVEDLLWYCVKLRERYGYYEKGSKLFQSWYGDAERFATLIGEVNVKIEKRDGTKHYLSITPPYDFEKQDRNRFENYFRRIQSYLTKDKKKLYLDNCDKLKNYILNLPSKAVMDGSFESYPAVGILGALIHSLLISKPWEHTVPTNPRGTCFPTFMNDEFEKHALMDDRASYRLLYGD
ncbi:MAG: hypothetical protein KAV87_29495, partial [Desulfobacteraceae bacterium]|nr:hypothetical protein [Desulfobacteraceae bacterium]